MLKPILDKRIYYHDTDCGGVVYYANYLKYFEEARTEFLSQNGIELKSLRDQGFEFAVSKVEIKYHAPARYDDRVSVYAEVKEVKNASLLFYQELRKKDRVLTSAFIEVVCLSPELKLRKLPASMKALASVSCK